MDASNITKPPKLPNLYARAAKIVKAILSDEPNELLMGFDGYFNYLDQTLLKPNSLVYPSKNCFIPLKDKIVPRPGKTLLGASYSQSDVAIGFDSFSISQQASVGAIQQLTPVEAEFGSSGLVFNSSVKVDATHVLNFWQNSGVNSFFGNLGSIVGTFVPGDLITGGTSGAHGQIISVSGGIYLIGVISGLFQFGDTIAGSLSGATATLGNPYGYSSAAYGNAQVFAVNPTTGALTAVGIPFIYEEFGGGANSAAQLDATHFINFWNNSSGAGGKAQIFSVNLSTYAVTALSSPLAFDSGSYGVNSCVKVDSSHFLNFWSHNTVAYAQAFAINLSTYAITAVGSPLTFDSSGNNISNSCGQINSGNFINFWTSTANIGKVQAFNVNLSTYAVTALSSALTFDAVNATYNSCAYIDATHFLNFWNHGVSGVAQVFAINASTYAITTVNAVFQFASVAVTYNSCAPLNSINFVNFWSQTTGYVSAAQYSQIFSLDELYNISALNTPLNFDNRSSSICNSCVVLGVTGTEELIVNMWGGMKVTSVFDLAGAVFQVSITTSNFSTPHPCAGDNRILFVALQTDNTAGGDQVTGVNYNGVAMTQVAKVALDSQREQYLYYLVNPAAGVNTSGINVTTNGIDRSLVIAATSYNGVAQVTPTIMSSVGPSASVSSISISETTILDDSYIMAFFSGGVDYLGGLVAGANTIFRGGNQNMQMADSGLVTPPGAKSLSANFASSTTGIAIAVAFAPFGGTPTDKNWPIVGHKKRFTNDGGYIMEARITQSGDPAYGDILEVELPNPITGLYQWYQVTENSNPLPVGTAERYYMDQILDTNQNSAADRINSRLVWVNGSRNIFSWSGGVAPIISMVPGVSITTTLGKTWASMGFMVPTLGGLNYIVVNGTKYQVLTNVQILTLVGTVGAFQIGDKIVGSSSGATAQVLSVFGLTITVGLGVGEFNTADNITGSISGATALVGVVDQSDGGWASNTLLLASTDGIAVGDYATAYIMPPNSATWMQDINTLPNNFPIIDYCRQLKNYMYYGSFSSKKLFQSNSSGKNALETVNLASDYVFLDDLSVPLIADFSGMGTSLFRITIDGAGSPDTFHYQVTDTTGAVYNSPLNIPITAGLPQLLTSPYFGSLSIIFGNNTGHVVGDSWVITATQSVGNININQSLNYVGNPLNLAPWATFYYSPTRMPGEGYVYNLPANFNTMEQQEDSMYVNDQYGNWGFITTTLAADLLTETLSYTPLKQTSSSKVLYPYLVTHMENALIYVTSDYNVDMIERKAFVELPQIGYISQAVDNDFKRLSFLNGSMEYVNKQLYITSPNDNEMMVYDNKDGTKYWQPPQEYSENGILSIVDNVLISHSNLRNQTFNLFTGDDDDGSAYTVEMRTPANPCGNRWGYKSSNKSFIEGYYSGKPKLVHILLLGVNGASRIIPHNVQPVSDKTLDNGSLGTSNLGTQSLGSGTFPAGLIHFNEVNADFDPIMQYYFIAHDLLCTSKKHSYEVLSMGVNFVAGNLGNNDLIPEEIISKD